MRTVYLNASYFPAVELLSAIGTAAIILYGGYQAIDGKIEIGVVVAFIGYLQLFFDPIQQISQLYTTYQQGMAALDKIFDLLDTEPDMVDRAGRDRPRAAARRDRARRRLVLLRARRRRDAASSERRGAATATAAAGWALAGIDLHVPAGPDGGAGRRDRAPASRRWRSWWRASTTRSAGGCWSTATTCASCARSALRSQLGIVPQEGFLFSGTIRDNIAFGRPDASEEEILAAARAVGADAFVDRLPDGFDTEVGERGVAALGRPAPARRLRARAARRAADPDPRRGDLERRRAHRARDRAGARAAARRPHRDRDRPPAVDDQARGADRRPRARADRRVGHPRRADRGRRALRAALRRLGASRRPRRAASALRADAAGARAAAAVGRRGGGGLGRRAAALDRRRGRRRRRGSAGTGVVGAGATGSAGTTGVVSVGTSVGAASSVAAVAASSPPLDSPTSRASPQTSKPKRPRPCAASRPASSISCSSSASGGVVAALERGDVRGRSAATWSWSAARKFSSLFSPSVGGGSVCSASSSPARIWPSSVAATAGSESSTAASAVFASRQIASPWSMKSSCERVVAPPTPVAPVAPERDRGHRRLVVAAAANQQDDDDEDAREGAQRDQAPALIDVHELPQSNKGSTRPATSNACCERPFTPQRAAFSKSIRA